VGKNHFVKLVMSACESLGKAHDADSGVYIKLQPYNFCLYESCRGALLSVVSSLCGTVEPSVEFVSGFTYVSVRLRVIGVMHICGSG